MGKIDDMRRQREAQHAEQERASQGRAPGAPIARAPVPLPTEAAPAELAIAADAPQPPPAAAPRIALPTSRTPRGADEQGKCTGCGKLRPLVNGLVANHQKGLGKMCTGSRKEPA